MNKRYVFALFACLVLSLAGCNKFAGSKAAESSKRVFFVSPKDGDTVPATFKVEFGLEGMKVRPAGEDATEKTSGHHHILVDNEQGYIEAGQVVPKDETHIHFGKGETSTTLTLSPGKHKISLQLADGAHISYGKDLSASITVTVEAPKQ